MKSDTMKEEAEGKKRNPAGASDSSASFSAELAEGRTGGMIPFFSAEGLKYPVRGMGSASSVRSADRGQHLKRDTL